MYIFVDICIYMFIHTYIRKLLEYTRLLLTRYTHR